MTGTEKIKNKILEDAKARAVQIEEQARTESNIIMESALKKVGLQKEELMKKAESESAEAYKRMMSVAGLEGRKEILRTKQDLVDAAFKRAMEKVAGLPDPEYQKLLEDMVVRIVEKDGGEILLTEKDHQRIDSQFLTNINKRLKSAGIHGSLTLSEDKIQASGGFILRRGEMELNSTFEILFTMLRTELENDVVKILFSNIE
ncbi:MAG: V-type ATP synthase subunit E family protein [Clostridiaceae bacterium]